MDRSPRLQRYLGLGLLDEEDAIEDPEAAERDAAMLEEMEAEDARDSTAGRQRG